MLKFSKPTLITLTGPTCSGKSHIFEHLVKSELTTKITSTTTRPMRAGEVDGVHYHFLPVKEAECMLKNGKFIEHNEFLGNHYGVTSTEFTQKVLKGNPPPIIILEPNGVATYEKVCKRFNIDILKLFVSTQESRRIDRLNNRLKADLEAVNNLDDSVEIHEIHEKRLQSVVTERSWIHTNIWDAVLNGEDLNSSLEMIERAVRWKNRMNEVPKAYNHD